MQLGRVGYIHKPNVEDVEDEWTADVSALREGLRKLQTLRSLHLDFVSARTSQAWRRGAEAS